MSIHLKNSTVSLAISLLGGYNTGSVRLLNSLMSIGDHSLSADLSARF